MTRLPNSARRTAILRNALYGALDYLAQPLGLLLATPYLLRHLGAQQFGIWVVACAAVNSGNLVSSGFGDAAIKYVAMYRGQRDEASIPSVVRGLLSINLVLSGITAAALWALTPWFAHRIVPHDPALFQVCESSLRIGCLLLAVRAIDGVFGSALRAFERYSITTRISTGFRFGVLAAAVLCAYLGSDVTTIMRWSLLLALLSAVIQGAALRAITGNFPLYPSFEPTMLSRLVRFGCFSWLQTASAIAFNQLDRLVVGVALGASAVAIYGVCAQLAQSIHGLVAGSLHVLFPHLSARIESDPATSVASTVRLAFKGNIAIALLLGAPIAIFSRPILTLWVGADIARQASTALSLLALAYTFFAVNVTAHYTLLALGRVRLVTALNLAAGVAMALLLWPLTRRFGLAGAAGARLVTGPITCLLYLPVVRWMQAGARPQPTPIECEAAPCR